MGMMATYIMLIFSVSVVFMLMGYHGAMWDVLTSSFMPDGTPTPISDLIINAIFQVFLDPRLLAIIVGGSITAFLLGGSNFSVMFLIPLLIIEAVMNYFILPTSLLFDASAGLLGIGVWLFLNILLMLAIIEFVRGQV